MLSYGVQFITIHTGSSSFRYNDKKQHGHEHLEEESVYNGRTDFVLHHPRRRKNLCRVFCTIDVVDHAEELKAHVWKKTVSN